MTAVAVPARASKTFPAIVAEHVGVELPAEGTECLLCHTSREGGEETATKPVARSLRELGLGSTTRSLRSALEKAGDVDSDEDGVPDFEELAQRRDPNVAEVRTEDGAIAPAPPGDEAPPFQTGCALRRSGGGRGVLGALLVIGALSRRRRR